MDSYLGLEKKMEDQELSELSVNGHTRLLPGDEESTIGTKSNSKVNDESDRQPSPMLSRSFTSSSPMSAEYFSSPGSPGKKGGLGSSYASMLKLASVLLMPLIILVALFIVVSNTSGSSRNARLSSPNAAPTGSTYPSGFDMKNDWGSISPYFDSGAAFDGISEKQKNLLYGMPSQCKLDQVHVLHRHAQRYPTTGRSKQMLVTAERIQNMNVLPEGKNLQWLVNWTYELGTELLTPPGVSTEFKSGSDFWASHGRFLFEPAESTDDRSAELLFYSRNLTYKGQPMEKLVLRATDQSRIRTSARAWAAGFFGVYGGQEYSADDRVNDGQHADDLYSLVLQEEKMGSNSTLASYVACPNAANPKVSDPKKYQREWAAIYLDAAAQRLQKVLPGIPNITIWDAFAMQDFCSFETAAYGSSPFCELFTETEWRGYEYMADLDFYYGASFGSYVAAAEGAGWLTELVARLQGKLIEEPQNGVNITLDGNETTFPLGQPVYLDMTHDSVISSVLTALDLDFLKKPLPSDHMPVPRQFIVSRLTPFGARLFVEVFDCGVEKQIRLKLNNRILPLGDLPDCPVSADGLCPFNSFVSSLETRIKDINFDEICYGEIRG